MSEWKMVPVQASVAMLETLFIPDDPNDDEPDTAQDRWRAALGFAPPLPAEVLEQMVERGVLSLYGSLWPIMHDGMKQFHRDTFRTALLAALGDSHE